MCRMVDASGRWPHLQCQTGVMGVRSQEAMTARCVQQADGQRSLLQNQPEAVARRAPGAATVEVAPAAQCSAGILVHAHLLTCLLRPGACLRLLPQWHLLSRVLWCLISMLADPVGSWLAGGPGCNRWHAAAPASLFGGELQLGKRSQGQA